MVVELLLLLLLKCTLWINIIIPKSQQRVLSLSLSLSLSSTLWSSSPFVPYLFVSFGRWVKAKGEAGGGVFSLERTENKGCVLQCGLAIYIKK
jgi:hypothetical protein